MEDKVPSVLNIVNAISPIISAILTGIVTFIVTKYTYHRNRPLDKLEIAYNNVYFPIYDLIVDAETSNEFIISECDRYFELYKKHIDNATIRAYNTLKEDIKNQKNYNNFKNNILEKNSYLRRRLGYLESSIFEIYRYSSNLAKHQIKCLGSFALTYIVLLLINILVTLKVPDQIINTLMIVGIISFCILVYQTLRLVPWGMKKVGYLLHLVLVNLKRYFKSINKKHKHSKND